MGGPYLGNCAWDDAAVLWSFAALHGVGFACACLAIAEQADLPAGTKGSAFAHLDCPEGGLDHDSHALAAMSVHAWCSPCHIALYQEAAAEQGWTVGS